MRLQSCANFQSGRHVLSSLFQSSEETWWCSRLNLSIIKTAFQVFNLQTWQLSGSKLFFGRKSQTSIDWHIDVGHKLLKMPKKIFSEEVFSVKTVKMSWIILFVTCRKRDRSPNRDFQQKLTSKDEKSKMRATFFILFWPLLKGTFLVFWPPF